MQGREAPSQNADEDQRTDAQQIDAPGQVPVSDAETRAAAAPPTPPIDPRRQAQQQRLRGIVAAMLAVLVIIIVIWNVAMHSPASTTSTNSATAAATPRSAVSVPATPAAATSLSSKAVAAPATRTQGVQPPVLSSHPGGSTTAPTIAVGAHVLAVGQIIGARARLRAPEQAIVLRTGAIAVADTGNKRLVILKPNGALFRSTQLSGGGRHMKAPFSLAAGANYIYLLDPKRGSIDQYTLDGAFVRELMLNPVLLGDARGISIAPNTLYVANPRGNDVVAIGIPSGAILRRYKSKALGSGSDQFNQPTGVFATSDGQNIYVLDTVNSRMKVLNVRGGVTRVLSIPPSDTIHPNWMVVLPDGRLVLSNPAGALFVYPAKGRSPTRYTLSLRGRPLRPGLEPQGISVRKDGSLLVTDVAGNRLLAVSLPS